MPISLSLLDRTADLRTDVLALLESAATENSAGLVTRLQHVANDLGAAERMLIAA
ncbi:MAG: hypothetical protein ACJ762_02200 [Solirubrobacteraceae bacterium]